MTARYLVRFDDIAPGMNWRVWDEVERILVERRVRPILAVVPDNRDPDLEFGERRSDFWSRVREWQSRGWTIGLHGFQHKYRSRDGGIIGLNRDSEFAGVARDDQETMIRSGLQIFESEKVRADVWVAPAHSFDEITLDLLQAMGVSRISDGYFLQPHTDRRGFVWVPQQLWRFRWRPFGTWTVCYHVNHWSAADLSRFGADLDRFRSRVVDFDDACARGQARRRNVLDGLVQSAYLRYLFLLRGVASWRRKAV